MPTYHENILILLLFLCMLFLVFGGGAFIADFLERHFPDKPKPWWWQ